MKRNFLVAVFVSLTMAFASAGLAQTAEPLPLPVKKQPQASRSSVPVAVRSESLELPGLTACHQCEWRPKPNEMAAPEQCGIGADGKPLLAQFECGFSQECDRVCNFVRCLPQ